MNKNKKKLWVTSIIAVMIYVAGVDANTFGQCRMNLQRLPCQVQLDNQEKLTSGAVCDVPWEKDPKFIEARDITRFPLMLVAFRTVLRDPLPGEEDNVKLAADRLCGIVVRPQEIFSQNQKLGPYTAEKGFKKGPTYVGSMLTTTVGGGVCKIASTLYNASVLCNMKVIERHSHGMPVPYVPYGQDATVAYGAKDFKFMNNANSSIFIWAMEEKSILHIAFYGVEPPPKVEWSHEILNSKKAEVIYRKNPELQAGEEKLILEGMDGATVKSSVIINDSDGNKVKKDMGISYYMSMPSLVEIKQ